jgi:transcriptional antiterminator NusG
MSPSVRRPSSESSLGGLRWYVLKVQNGREEAVKEALERRVRIEGLDDVVGRVIVPAEKVVEVRMGRRIERTRKLFPGYLLCEVVLEDRVLALFRETPGVSDFVRSGSAPVPLSPIEMEGLLARQSEEKVNVVHPEFDIADRVRILRGTFAQMEGEVTEVLPATGQVRVRLTILERPVFLVVEASEILQLSGC